jgi:putative sterol carrier protein
MSEREIGERLQNILPQLKKLSGVIKFDSGEDGRWLVDARQLPASLIQDVGDIDADCTILISAENLEKMLDGKLDPMLAYGLGKIKVKGSMGLAMQLVSAIG